MSLTLSRGRFAPSPTGPLHAGSLFTAFASWLLARHAGGEWIVRIEDVDRDRCVPGAAEHQIATLATFGMVSDIPVVWQSQRDALYRTALEHLLEAGSAFVCGCSRAQLSASAGIHHHCVAPPRADGRNAVRLSVADSPVMHFDDRLQGPQTQDLASTVGDVVLHRADGCWAYQLAVVVDDADQGITEVVRGADLLDSTARQIWLQRQLSLPTPTYLHLPLLRDAEGRKLSKSEAALPIEATSGREALRWFWQLLGQPVGALDTGDTPSAMLELARQHFQPQQIPRQLPPVPTMPTGQSSRSGHT